MDEQFKKWIDDLLTKESVNVWREVMAQLRRLSDDVWNGLRFFLSFNAILIAACVAVTRLQRINAAAAIILIGLAIFGLLITILARAIMVKQRDYYLRMLLKKSLIEEQLGFYEVKLSGVDMTTIWRVAPEHLSEMKRAPDEWVRNRRRGKETVTRLLFWVYEGLIALYLIGLGLLLIGLCKGWFSTEALKL